MKLFLAHLLTYQMKDTATRKTLKYKKAHDLAALPALNDHPEFRFCKIKLPICRLE